MKVGFTKLSTIDYPNEICSVIFFPGCNFRCGYCHNIDVVKGKVDYELNEVLEELKEDYQIIPAVCLSGGEPTLYKDLPEVVAYLKNLDFLIKLDTNGSHPELLEKLKPQLDYVAMDIKGPLRKYQAIANYNNIENIKKSVEIIKTLPDYEFRTTVSPSFLAPEEIQEIAVLLKGAKRYVLQGFKNTPFYKAEEPTTEWLNEIAQNIRSHFSEINVRGGR